jgi:histidinol-phosphate aminotransferase
MNNRSGISRRNFIASAALGAAVGIRFPSSNGVAAGRARTNDEARPEPLLLHRNESPYGLAPGAAAAAQTILTSQANRYPIEEPKALEEALAKRFGLDKEMIALGCGSIEILKMATETFCSPLRPAVVAEPTFEAVVSYSRLMHSHAAKIPLTGDHKHDLARMLHRARQGAGMVFFCNPSNPAGTYIAKNHVESFVRGLPRETVLLADEAYLEYATARDYESCLRYVKDGFPVIVSHTFSKVYGMAGLRVGYAIGRKDLIKRIKRRRLESNPNQVATAAAIAALKQDDPFVGQVRTMNAEVRDYTCRELGAVRLPYIPSETNFVMIAVGRPAEPLIEALKKRNVLVGRLFPSMPNHMRVSLGTRPEMERFLTEFKQVLGPEVV